MLNAESFFWIATLAGIAYAVVIQVLRNKFVNMDRMKELQKKMNELNKQYFDALKKKDNKRMDSIQAEQNAVMPEFNGMLVGQLKFTFVVLLVFLSFMWVMNSIDPNNADDFTFQMDKQGDLWCGNFSFGNGTEGPWLVDVKAYSGTSQKSQNGAIIYYGMESSQFMPFVTVSGEQTNVTTDKKAYYGSESPKVCALAPADADRVVATANSGTWFHVGLPFEIPLLNTRTLSGVNIWFIVIAIVGGLLFPKIMDAFKKKKVV